MSLFDLDPNQTWLFCPTHPDDEITICAWIRRLVRNGNKVYISWTHNIPVREAEARQVARLLGVPQENLFFHGATDGAACDEIPALLPKFRAMMEVVQPDRVVCGAFEQGHLDHDATNYLVCKTSPCMVLEVPFYHTYTTRLQTLNRFSSSEGEQVVTLDESDRQLKLQVAKMYPSQNIWKVLFYYELWQKLKFTPARLWQTERMRRHAHRGFYQPNHPGEMAEKVQACASWKRWVKALERFESGAMELPREMQSQK